jgi:hypothetical protein
MDSQSQLLEIIDALCTARSFAGRLHGGQQQRDENGDDGDHHEEFDESEARAANERRTIRHSHFPNVFEGEDECKSVERLFPSGPWESLCDPLKFEREYHFYSTCRMIACQYESPVSTRIRRISSTTSSLFN